MCMYLAGNIWKKIKGSSIKCFCLARREDVWKRGHRKQAIKDSAHNRLHYVEDRRAEKRKTFCVQRTQFYKTWKNGAVPTTDPFMVSIWGSFCVPLNGMEDAIWWYWELDITFGKIILHNWNVSSTLLKIAAVPVICYSDTNISSDIFDLITFLPSV